MAVRGVDDLDPRKVDTAVGGQAADARFRADEDGADQPLGGSVDGAAKRGFVAGVNNDGGDGREGARRRDQTVMLGQGCFGLCHRWRPLMLRFRQSGTNGNRGAMIPVKRAPLPRQTPRGSRNRQRADGQWRPFHQRGRAALYAPCPLV